MKNKLTKAICAAALVGMLGSAHSALAACAGSTGFTGFPNLGNLNDAGCKLAAACQKAILDASRVYVNKIQTSINNIVISNNKGTNTLPVPYACQGGAANGAVCFANNGLCKDLANKGKPCGADSDCTGAVALSCDRTKGCNKLTANDLIECQPGPSTVTGAKDYTTQKAAFRKSILSKCQSDLLLPAPASAKLVDVEDVGLDTQTACPGVNPALAVPPAPNEHAGWEAVLTCLLGTMDGDVKGSGGVVDTILRPMGKAMGNTMPQAKLVAVTGIQAKDPLPRIMVEIAGSNLLQIGAKQTDTTIGQGGTAAPLSFASCDNGLAPVCLNNIDCATGGHCVRDLCKTCAGGSRAGQACVALANCPGGGTCTGPCPSTTTSQLKATSPANRGISGTDGNILTVTQTCAGPATPVCLLTRTKDSGNGTPSMGLEDFASGAYKNHAPIETTVVIGVDCPICGTGVPIGGKPTCGIGPASQGNCAGFPGSDAGPNVGLKCNEAGNADSACPPTTTGFEPHIPNPFDLSTASKTISDVTGGGAGTKKLCGYCDTVAGVGCTGGAALCAIGCQSVVDCPAPATVCDYASTLLGFHGDTTIGSVTVVGDLSVHAPTYAGVFCTGITGSPAVDPAVGLPGAVKSINPYVNLFIFSKDL